MRPVVCIILAAALVIFLLLLHVLIEGKHHKAIAGKCCMGALHGSLIGGIMGGAMGSLRMAVALGCIAPINMFVEKVLLR